MNSIEPKSAFIVFVEDDTELAGLIVERLTMEGYRVAHFPDGERACEAILSQKPDLVILDIMLPGMDGYGVCKNIRPQYDGPILILSALDDDLDQLLGFELGADDFVVKPIRPRLLLARVRALLRRGIQKEAPVSTPDIFIGSLKILTSRREVYLNDNLIYLTTVEFDLLKYMAEKAGEVVSRDDLHQALYNTEYDGLDRSIDVYVSRVRQKLGDDPVDPQYLLTVRGVGYLLKGPAA